MSIPIDFGILAIPMKILKSTTLHKHEMRILNLVFAANLLGTIKWYFSASGSFHHETLTSGSILGIYGVWENRVAFAADAFYQETIFIMLNNVEILMYTIGASFPGTLIKLRHDRLLLSAPEKASNPPDEQYSPVISWRARLPLRPTQRIPGDFLLSLVSLIHSQRHSHHALLASSLARHTQHTLPRLIPIWNGLLLPTQRMREYFKRRAKKPTIS